jgi:hypothetical protein
VGRAVLAVQVPLERAEERVTAAESRRGVKYGKRSPSDTRPAEPPSDSKLTSIPAGQRVDGGRGRS